MVGVIYLTYKLFPHAFFHPFCINFDIFALHPLPVSDSTVQAYSNTKKLKLIDIECGLPISFSFQRHDSGKVIADGKLNVHTFILHVSSSPVEFELQHIVETFQALCY